MNSELNETAPLKRMLLLIQLNKYNNFKIKNSHVGYSRSELQKLSFEELLELKISAMVYLINKNAIIKNLGLFDLINRINDELKDKTPNDNLSLDESTWITNTFNDSIITEIQSKYDKIIQKRLYALSCNSLKFHTQKLKICHNESFTIKPIEIHNFLHDFIKTKPKASKDQLRISMLSPNNSIENKLFKKNFNKFFPTLKGKKFKKPKTFIDKILKNSQIVNSQLKIQELSFLQRKSKLQNYWQNIFSINLEYNHDILNYASHNQLCPFPVLHLLSLAKYNYHCRLKNINNNMNSISSSTVLDEINNIFNDFPLRSKNKQMELIYNDSQNLTGMESLIKPPQDNG